MDWCARYYLPVPGDWLEKSSHSAAAQMASQAVADAREVLTIPIHLALLADNANFLRKVFRGKSHLASPGIVRAGYFHKSRAAFSQATSEDPDKYIPCWVEPLDVYFNESLLEAVEFAFYDCYWHSARAGSLESSLAPSLITHRDPVAEIVSTGRWELVAALLHAERIEIMSRCPRAPTRGRQIFTGAGQFIPMNIPAARPEVSRASPRNVSHYLANLSLEDRCQFFLELADFFDQLVATPGEWARALFWGDNTAPPAPAAWPESLAMLLETQLAQNFSGDSRGEIRDGAHKKYTKRLLARLVGVGPSGPAQSRAENISPQGQPADGHEELSSLASRLSQLRV